MASPGLKNVLLVGFGLLFCVADATLHRRIGFSRRRGLAQSGTVDVKVFDITQYGAVADDVTNDSTMAFMQAWNESCRTSTDPAKLVVPEGTFVTGPVIFQGPCSSPGPITVEVRGTIKATTDPSEYMDDSWFLFERIDGLVLTGGGTFDGQGATVWKYNDCKKNSDCTRLPTSIKLQGVKNAVVYNITSVNSKYFHMHITDCNNYTAHNLNISAPANSPNTDGMHISNTDLVHVTKSNIGTGDDCISIGQGVTNANISEIFCGPGHGISVGSLGKYENEKDVSGIVVTNCTLSNTSNGVRIKTYAASPPSNANSIVFQDIVMDSVKNPIVIDQKYASRKRPLPSQVKISDVHFKNIKGTSTSNIAVSIQCSTAVPCEGIGMVDIDLSYNGRGLKNTSVTASCLSASVTSGGTMNPPACQ